MGRGWVFRTVGTGERGFEVGRWRSFCEGVFKFFIVLWSCKSTLYIVVI